MHNKRKKIWIDRFQTLLFCRIAMYFVFYQIGVWSIVSIEANLSTRLAELAGAGLASWVMWMAFGVVIMVSILFIMDAIRFAHRIVGPLVRFRHVCRAIRDGESVPLVRLRKHDFLDEFRDEFNDMLKALQERGALTLQADEEKTAESKPVETAASN